MTSHGIDANLPAEVEVNKRVEDGKTYIDFEFYFPDIPAECAQTNGTYPNMSVGTATNATNAESAVKAKQDGDGNEISTTYAKQNGTYPGLTAGAAQRVARAGIINSGRQGWWRFLDVQYTGSTSADAALDEIFVVNGVLDD